VSSEPRGFCPVCGYSVPLRFRFHPRPVSTHDFPPHCRRVCRGSGLPALDLGNDGASQRKENREHGSEENNPADLSELGDRRTGVEHSAAKDREHEEQKNHRSPPIKPYPNGRPHE
jgi:hypothetical protein